MNLHLDFSQPARNSVQAVLASHASDVNFGDGTETQVCFGREKQPGHAKFRNGWFRIDVPLVADDAGLPSSSDIWAALKQARELHGAKVVLPVGGESLTVRAEFAVHDSEAGNAVWRRRFAPAMPVRPLPKHCGRARMGMWRGRTTRRVTIHNYRISCANLAGSALRAATAG